MKIIPATRIEDGENHCIGEVREGKFYPQAIEMSAEDLWKILKLMKKELPEPQPRDNH